MNLPFVTLIFPIRNESAYIEDAFSAILKQDYPKESIEILVADGMSTDATRRIIRDISVRQPDLRIQILDNPGRIVPTGMNVALRQAQGDIIIRVDGHCIIAMDYISRCVRHLQTGKVDGVGGPMESVGETIIAKGIAIGMSSPFGVGNSSFRVTYGKSVLADTVPFPAYTRQIIERVGYYDEELIRNQDDEYNYRIRELSGKILLADDVHSTYFSRTSLKGLWSQYFQYGYWKVRVLQKHPLQMSLRQFVPPLFVMALVVSTVLFLFSPFRALALLVPTLYVVANLLASIWTAARRGWKYFLLLPLVFAILHLSYGSGFLVGLVRFWNRWGDRIGKTPVMPKQSNG